MRNNPYNKNLKDQMPLFMQGPSSINALISNEGQKSIIEKAMLPPSPKKYQIIDEDRFDNVSFTMISPPLLNMKGIPNPSNLLKTEMGRTEVTQELFLAVMGWNDSSSKYHDERNPVENVTWYDCISFCNKLSNLLGLEECYHMTDIEKESLQTHIIDARVLWYEDRNGFRLPTGDEWELFAKAGTNNRWSGTDEAYVLDQYAWSVTNSGTSVKTVGRKLPNEWGLYDMSGNVCEWCWDLWDPEEDDKYRISCGGSYRDCIPNIPVTDRQGMHPGSFYRYRGFRLCRSWN